MPASQTSPRRWRAWPLCLALAAACTGLALAQPFDFFHVGSFQRMQHTGNTAGQAGIFNPGPHGFSEVLYAFTSAGNNNGSAFAGLGANTLFYNVTLAIAMWFGRFAVIVPVLAMAGSLAAKKRIAATAGTLPTHGPLFVTLLIGTVLLVGLLNYVPALALGPVVEHFMLWAGH